MMKFKEIFFVVDVLSFQTDTEYAYVIMFSIKYLQNTIELDVNNDEET